MNENQWEATKIPLIALRGLTVFPQMLLHFDVGRDKSKKALEAAMKTNQSVFLVAQKDLRVDDPKPTDLYKIGTVSKIKQMLKLPGGGIRILVEGQDRGRVLDYLQFEPFIEVMVQPIPPAESKAGEEKTVPLLRLVRDLFEEYARLGNQVDPQHVMEVLSNDDPGYVADYIAQNIQIDAKDKQSILDELRPVKRLEKVAFLLTKETEILSAEIEIQQKVRERLDKNQKEYVLREQLSAIRAELGEKEDTFEEAETYASKIRALKLPQETEEKLLKEAARLSRLGPNSAETGLLRTYLDTVLDLPWNKRTKDRLDLSKVEKSLNADHYGMQKIKERILEFIAVKALSPDVKNQILCLVGPPGVGKTSVGMSIAKAMGRKIARVSLGGVRDEADIRGHRKTYIGAMPGRIMTALSQAGAKNAVLLLDEVDKLGADYKGDPSAALLEVLDAEQNHSFRDHYIEVPFDLSEVLFITTANTTDTIPRPLLDRMEVIELSSYTMEEKVQIAKRHLLPKQIKLHGMKRTQLRITDDGLRAIIEGYTREPGVRTLERMLAACCRKAARKIAAGEAEKVSVTPDNVTEFLGNRRYKPEHLDKTHRVGVVNGLAWTQSGGEILEAEVNIMPGSGKLELTGNLGSVMQESARAAISYLRAHAKTLGISETFYKEVDIHVHFPEGAIPKDGPSAGITIATAILSALSNRPVRYDVAMTGEITLRGRVLPIGGLKEKTMAAYRAGIKDVIIPADNEPDLQDIDQTVRQALSFKPVSTIGEVFDIALLPAPAEEEKEIPQEEPEQKELAVPAASDPIPAESRKPLCCRGTSKEELGM